MLPHEVTAGEGDVARLTHVDLVLVVSRYVILQGPAVWESSVAKSADEFVLFFVDKFLVFGQRRLVDEYFTTGWAGIVDRRVRPH